MLDQYAVTEVQTKLLQEITMTQKLVLIRGLPGSGKTHQAKNLAELYGWEHYEADHYMLNKFGEYEFDSNKLKTVHNFCQANTERTLELGRTVIVANTFTRIWEMQPYIDMAAKLKIKCHIFTATGNYANVHNVPEETIERMRSNWEPIPDKFIDYIVV